MRLSKFFRRQPVILCRPDESQSDPFNQVGQLLAVNPVAFSLIHFRNKILVQFSRVGLEPGGNGFLSDQIGFSFVDDGEPLLQSDCCRFLPHDVMCQSMQGTYAVSERHGHFEKFFDATGEVVYSRVD